MIFFVCLVVKHVDGSYPCGSGNQQKAGMSASVLDQFSAIFQIVKRQAHHCLVVGGIRQYWCTLKLHLVSSFEPGGDHSHAPKFTQSFLDPLPKPRETLVKRTCVYISIASSHRPTLFKAIAS